MMSGPRDLILDRIRITCDKIGRDPASIGLVAVSKLQTTEAVLHLAKQGQADFGENYVQEFSEKFAQPWPREMRWHFIGHLQKNKIKGILGHCHRIHSVDSKGLLEALDKKAREAGLIENVLLQINVAGESAKGGFSPRDLHRDLSEMASLSAIRLRGFMTMPPLQNEPEQNRPHFRELAGLLAQARATLGTTLHSLDELSMGTSHDFEVALEEGATWIRVGTLIFGERPKK